MVSSPSNNKHARAKETKSTSWVQERKREKERINDESSKLITRTRGSYTKHPPLHLRSFWVITTVGYHVSRVTSHERERERAQNPPVPACNCQQITIVNDYQTFNYEAREKLKGIEKGVAGFTTLVFHSVCLRL